MPAGSFEPESATFVSTQRGWLLEARGNGTAQRVLTTRDGGRSWSLVGAAPALADVESPATLRFADAQHGFLFERSQLYVTGDGGAHWSAAAPPGRPVQDLATWGGRVYVIAQRLDDPNGSFGIFSAPVAAPAAWIADPLHLALGAGPVPEVRFTVAQGHAWIVDNDRVVGDGARQMANGGWQSWRPPCYGKGGAVQLAASTASDVVALCDEGAWTGPGPVVNAIYTSHDGGATSVRRVAPENGYVASPSPQVAIIGGGRLWRTTDDGATWHQVLNAGAVVPDSSMQELGFTTSTQGYVITSRSGMFMTYDAGATWTRVVAP